jgi:hypothetical protein
VASFAQTAFIIIEQLGGTLAVGLPFGDVIFDACRALGNHRAYRLQENRVESLHKGQKHYEEYPEGPVELEYGVLKHNFLLSPLVLFKPLKLFCVEWLLREWLPDPIV